MSNLAIPDAVKNNQDIMDIINHGGIVTVGKDGTVRARSGPKSSRSKSSSSSGGSSNYNSSITTNDDGWFVQNGYAYNPAARGQAWDIDKDLGIIYSIADTAISDTLRNAASKLGPDSLGQDLYNQIMNSKNTQKSQIPLPQIMPQIMPKQYTQSPRMQAPDLPKLFQEMLRMQEGKAEQMLRQMAPQINQNAEARGLFNSGIPSQLEGEAMQAISSQLLTEALNAAFKAAGIDMGVQSANMNQFNQDRNFGLAQDQFNWRKALDEAGMTGMWNGQMTPAMQNQLFNQMLGLAGVTGYMPNGTATAAMQNQLFNQGVVEAGLTGMYKGAPTWQADTWAKEFGLREKLTNKQLAELENKIKNSTSNVNADGLNAILSSVYSPYSSVAGNPDATPDQIRSAYDQSKALLDFYLSTGLIDDEMYNSTLALLGPQPTTPVTNNKRTTSFIDDLMSIINSTSMLSPEFWKNNIPKLNTTISTKDSAQKGLDLSKLLNGVVFDDK